MKKIYVVSAGSYSHYKVIALFSTEELARGFMVTFPYMEYNDIQQYDLDIKAVDLAKRGYLLWYVTMLKNGLVKNVIKTQMSLHLLTRLEYPTNIKHWIVRSHKSDKPDILQSVVWAKTEKQAIKITNERRVQIIALGEWD